MGWAYKDGRVKFDCGKEIWIMKRVVESDRNASVLGWTWPDYVNTSAVSLSCSLMHVSVCFVYIISPKQLSVCCVWAKGLAQLHLVPKKYAMSLVCSCHSFPQQFYVFMCWLHTHAQAHTHRNTKRHDLINIAEMSVSIPTAWWVFYFKSLKVLHITMVWPWHRDIACLAILHIVFYENSDNTILCNVS